jgi:prevent-host-death family protein
MQIFSAEELQRRSAEVQQAAAVEPVIITFHERPRLVMMSVEEFDRLRGRRHFALEPLEPSASVLDRLQEIADAYPVSDDDLKLQGGLLDAIDDPSHGGPAVER